YQGVAGDAAMLRSVEVLLRDPTHAVDVALVVRVAGCRLAAGRDLAEELLKDGVDEAAALGGVDLPPALVGDVGRLRHLEDAAEQEMKRACGPLLEPGGGLTA